MGLGAGENEEANSFFMLRHICEFCSLEQPLPFGRGDLLQISRSRAGEEETNLSSCFSPSSNWALL